MTAYDAGAFQDFEHSGWNDVADVYAELMDAWGLTVGPAGAAILDAADVRQGRDVLDVATGPGSLAGLALERGANVVGIDIAESMVQLARRRHPTAAFHVGAAESLPLPDSSYDAVVSAWGLPHFADHAAFFAEARRVLRPGGTIALGTWCPPPGNQFFALLLGALTPHLTANPNLPAGPDMFRYANADNAERDLTQAAFNDIRIKPIAITARLDHGAEDLIRFLAAGSVRSRAMYQAQTPETRRQIEATLREQIGALPTQHGRTEVGLTAVVIAARK